MILRAFILAGTVCVVGSSASADQFYTSDRQTIRFGIEQDFANSLRVDNTHADLEIDYDAGVQLRAGIDFGPGLGSITDYHYYGNANTRFTPATIPPAFSFLGGTNGQTMWVLPQSQFANRIYLGVDTQQISATDRNELQLWNPGESRNAANSADRYIEVQLIDVRGPAGGSVSLYQTNAQGQPIIHWSTFENGITESDSIFIRTVGHQHFNWAFTKSGLYEVDLQLRTFTTLDLLKGDADRDSDVDLVDFNRLVTSFGRWGVGWSGGDFTGDGYADLDDFFLLQQNFGVGTNLPLTALQSAMASSGILVVPEPTSLAVLFLSAMFGCRRRGRRSR
jgi:hypothetical protein